MVKVCRWISPGGWRMSWYRRWSVTTPAPVASVSVPWLAPGSAPSIRTRKRMGLPLGPGPNTRCRSRAWNLNTMVPCGAVERAFLLVNRPLACQGPLVHLQLVGRLVVA